MNDPNIANPNASTSNSPEGMGAPIPPIVPARTLSSARSSVPPALAPLGELADERVPITGLVIAIEAMLRQPRRVMYQLGQGRSGTLIAAMLVIAIGASAVYGVVVGAFSGGAQLWMAASKVTLGLLLSALICLPSLYIFSCLSGSQARLIEVCGLVAGFLTLMTLLLIGFAPVAWVFSQSTSSAPAMGALHLVFWAIATWFGWRFLNSGFAHLSAQSSGGLQVWMLIFIMVALQMTTALRPILGTADTFLPTEKKFFVTHWAECLKE